MGKISSVAFSPNDNILATSSDDRTVRLWNLNQPDAPSIALPPLNKTITSLAFNKTIKLDNYGDAQLLAISTDDQKIQVWDINPFKNKALLASWGKVYSRLQIILWWRGAKVISLSSKVSPRLTHPTKYKILLSP